MRMTNILHIYTRVSSTAQQEEGTSLENQRNLGFRKANELGYEPKLWNEGGQSSFYDDLNNRPVLVSLLMLIETGVVKHLFVYNTDRLSRNQQTWAIIRYKLLKFGVTLHTVSGQMTLKNPVDDLMLGILSEISQYDNKIRSERSRLGRFYKVQQGFWKGGPPPFGYRLTNRRLEFDPFESDWVRKMYDWYCQGVTVKEIQSRLSRQGVMTRRGNQQWSLGSIQLILRNPVYSGYFEYTDKMVGETVRVGTPEIIDPYLFQIAQDKRQSNRVHKDQVKPVKHFYLLRGKLACGHCGSPMGGRINMKGHQNLYYCVQNERAWVKRGDDHNKWKRGGGCSMVRSVNIAVTDQLVWNVVAATIQEHWIKPGDIGIGYSMRLVGKDDNDKITTQELDGQSAGKCDDGSHPARSDSSNAPQKLTFAGGAETIDQHLTCPATVEYVQRLLASPEDDTVTDQHKKAVIDELVNRITVRFDPVAKKHHVDVEFKSTVQPVVQGLSAKPANSGAVADPIGDPVGGVLDDDNESDDAMRAKKVELWGSTIGTDQNYSVTVE
jgi:DNA invertase Pin-like site-specific DNA recombinase